MTDIVIYRGELCFITGIVAVTSYDENGDEQPAQIKFEVRKIETADNSGMGRWRYASREEVAFLPGSINFMASEWMQGTKNGQIE